MNFTALILYEVCVLSLLVLFTFSLYGILLIVCSFFLFVCLFNVSSDRLFYLSFIAVFALLGFIAVVKRFTI
jgi:hypothetical protein